MKSKILIVAIFILGIVVGYSWRQRLASMPQVAELRGGGYKFTNPLLECDLLGGDGFVELKLFKSKITELINKQIKGGSATHISVYFRDLNNGPWFGINERESFSPGSLLKVPMMMAALKQAEKGPAFLEGVVVYQGPTDTRKQEIKPREVMKIGESYTLDEIIRRMIVYSDNDAKDLLLANINGEILANTYQDLGIDGPTPEKTDNFMNIKSYAGFFRILFNGSYLSRDFSEKALKLLSQTDFKDGLAAGVPAEVLTAHKFGEREYLGKKQLHDCGIIYYPGHPYLLCVMSRGENINQLASGIKDISLSVYREISSQFR